MKNTDVIATLLFAFTQLPDPVREDCSEAFKHVINILKKEDRGDKNTADIASIVQSCEGACDELYLAEHRDDAISRKAVFDLLQDEQEEVHITSESVTKTKIAEINVDDLKALPALPSVSASEIAKACEGACDECPIHNQCQEFRDFMDEAGKDFDNQCELVLEDLFADIEECERIRKEFYGEGGE